MYLYSNSHTYLMKEYIFLSLPYCLKEKKITTAVTQKTPQMLDFYDKKVNFNFLALIQHKLYACEFLSRFVKSSSLRVGLKLHSFRPQPPPPPPIKQNINIQSTLLQRKGMFLLIVHCLQQKKKIMICSKFLKHKGKN